MAASSAPMAHMAAYLTTSPPLNWFADTGATHHFTPDLASLSHAEEYTGSGQLHVGNGKGLLISHTGSTSIKTLSNSFRLSNVLHVPSISKPLISVQKFAKDNIVFFEFHLSHFLIKDQVTQDPLLSGQSRHGLYSLTPTFASVPKPFTSLAERASTDWWHRRLGHPQCSRSSSNNQHQ